MPVKRGIAPTGCLPGRQRQAPERGGSGKRSALTRCGPINGVRKGGRGGALGTAAAVSELGALSALAPAPGWPSRPMHRGLLRAPGPAMRSLLPPHVASRLCSARPCSHPLQGRVRQGSEEAESLGCCQQWVTHSGSIKRLGAEPAAGDQEGEASWSLLRLVPDQEGCLWFPQREQEGAGPGQAEPRSSPPLDLPRGRGCGPRPLLSRTDSSNP